MPPLYREPMVLFYREGQSTRAVATLLGLSDEVVRQRLSRGRAVLGERIAKTVEATLRKSAPSAQFTVSVVAALPTLPLPAKSGGAGVAVWKATGLGKFTPALGAFGSSILAMFGSMFFISKASIEKANSPREGEFRKNVSRLRVVAIIIGVLIGNWLGEWVGDQEGFLIGLFGISVFELLVPLRWRRIQIQEGTWVAPEPEQAGPAKKLLDAFRSGSRAEVYTAIARLLFLAGFAPLAFYSAMHGYWYLPAFFSFLVVKMFFWGTKDSRNNELNGLPALRFGERAKQIGGMAVGFLFAYNLNRIPFAGPVQKLSPHWVLFNFCIILVHLVLLGALYLENRRHPQG